MLLSLDWSGPTLLKSSSEEQPTSGRSPGAPPRAGAGQQRSLHLWPLALAQLHQTACQQLHCIGQAVPALHAAAWARPARQAAAAATGRRAGGGPRRGSGSALGVSTGRWMPGLSFQAPGGRVGQLGGRRSRGLRPPYERRVYGKRIRDARMQVPAARGLVRDARHAVSRALPADPAAFAALCAAPCPLPLTSVTAFAVHKTVRRVGLGLSSFKATVWHVGMGFKGRGPATATGIDE